MNDKSMQQSQRFHGLDFLRGLMMSLGLVLHSAQMYMVNPVLDYYWDPARSLSMDILLFWINTFRMPVFFMLSGFFTAMLLRRRGPQQMFQDRYRRIVIPFLVFLPPLALVMTALRIIARNVMATGELGFDLNYIEDPEQLWNNTHNLWFLYYLILYIVTLRLAIMWLPSIANIEKSAPTQEVYAPITMLPVCLAFALIGGFSDIGRVSGNLSFVPALDVYLVYGICFAFGVLLYRRIMDLDVLARAWKKYMALATAMFFVALFSLLSKGSMDQLGYYPIHLILSLSTGVAIGYYMLAFVGLFSRYFTTYNRWIRYFSDSAYWIFIFHSIPMVVIAIQLREWDVNAELKFLLVLSGTLCICLASYQMFVRNGWIGELLNGKRSAEVPWQSGKVT